jgi:hypothetical protein
MGRNRRWYHGIAMKTDRPDKPIHRMKAGDSLDQQLRFAIQNKRLVEIRCLGRSRVAEPHDYGVNKGIERLFVFQLRAVPSSGKNIPEWRLLDTAKIEACVVLDEGFPGSRGASHRRHLEWDVLYARVG